MDDIKIKGAVGDPKRKKPRVANAKADIELIRKMLRANKFNVAEQGGMDPSLLKAIRNFQTKKNVPIPDGVIDPDGTTFKELKPAYAKWLKTAKDEQAAAAQKPVMMRAVRYRGETLYVLPKDWDKFLAGIRVQTMRIVKGYEGMARTQRKNYMLVLDGYDIQQDFWKNIGSVVIASVTLMDPPDLKMVNKFEDRISKLKAAAARGTMGDIDYELTMTQQAQEACIAHLEAHLDRFQFGAKGILIGSAAVGALSSAAFVAIAAPALVPVAGITLAEAAFVSGASIGILTSASTEMAKVPVGKSEGGGAAARKILLDGAINGITSMIPLKLPANFLDDIALKIAPWAAKVMPNFAKQHVQSFVQRLIKENCVQLVHSSVTQVMVLLHKSAVSGGKVPSGKDFVSSVAEIVFNTLTVGIFSKLDKSSKAWAVDSSTKLMKDALPKSLDKMLKSGPNSKITRDVREKILEEAHKAVYQNVLKEGYKVMLDQADAATGGSKVVDQTIKAVFNDSKVQKEQNAALKKAAAKHKIKL